MKIDVRAFNARGYFSCQHEEEFEPSTFGIARAQVLATWSKGYRAPLKTAVKHRYISWSDAGRRAGGEDCQFSQTRLLTILSFG